MILPEVVSALWRKFKCQATLSEPHTNGMIQVIPGVGDVSSAMWNDESFTFSEAVCRILLPAIRTKVRIAGTVFKLQSYPKSLLGSRFASVAQLDRASVFGTEGWRFESSRVHCFLDFAARRLFSGRLSNRTSRDYRPPPSSGLIGQRLRLMVRVLPGPIKSLCKAGASVISVELAQDAPLSFCHATGAKRHRDPLCGWSSLLLDILPLRAAVSGED